MRPPAYWTLGVGPLVGAFCPIRPWSNIDLLGTWATILRAPARITARRNAVNGYDLVIIGGGAAGINALKAAVTMKARVALVDRGPLGGTCVNLG